MNKGIILGLKYFSFTFFPPIHHKLELPAFNLLRERSTWLGTKNYLNCLTSCDSHDSKSNPIIMIKHVHDKIIF